MLRPIIFATVFTIGLQGSAHGLLEKYGHLLTEPPRYVCHRTNAPIKLDGKINEDSWNHAETISSFVDIRGDGFDAPMYETKVKMLWDDRYLYIGAVLEEPNIVATLKDRDSTVYRDNAFEVFVDPDGDGRNYFEFEVNAYGTLLDLALDRPYRSNAKFLIPYNSEGIQIKVVKEGTINDSNDTDKRWSVEMAIPANTLAVGYDNPLQAGNIWRMNFIRVQWLADGGNADYWACRALKAYLDSEGYVVK